MSHKSYTSGVVPVVLKTLLTTLVIWMTFYSHPAIADVLKAGEAVYQRCIACHSLDRNRTGPKHCGLFGRKAGSLEDFEYSKAMINSSIVWDKSTLDAFLLSPFETVPGTDMGYGGVWDAKDRANLIFYLQQVSNSAQCQ